MSRRAAVITQADVARAVRAAKQAGAGGVEVRPDGTIIILLSTETVQGRPFKELDDGPEVIL